MSGQTFIAACIGMRSGRDPLANRDAAVRLIDEAAAAGAAYVQTPEMTSLVERSRKDLFDKVGPEESDPTLAAMRELARKRRLTVHIGSIAVRSGDKIANRAYLIDPEGAITARYDISSTSTCRTANPGANPPPIRAATARSWPRRPGACLG
jgi:predicted amidohydrolase